MHGSLIQPNINKLTKLKDMQTCPIMLKTLQIFFILLYVFFGFDFGFINISSKIIRLSVKSVSFLFSFGVCLICFIYFLVELQIILNIWNTCQLISYLLPVIILLFAENSLFVLLKDLCVIDSELSVKSVPNFSYIILMLFVISLASLRIILSFFYCNFYPTYCIRKRLISILFTIPIAGTEILVVIYYFVFYLLYCHLRKFTEKVEMSQKPVVIYRHLYKFMVDSAQQSMQTFGNVFSAVLLFATPAVMLAVYIALKEIQIKISEEREVTLMGYLENFMTLLLVFTPVVSAGQLSSQCDKLKVVLHDKLLKVTDKDEALSIERFIHYIEARPFRFTVLKILKVDWSLPVVIINLLVTYLIVIIQFTHIELVRF